MDITLTKPFARDGEVDQFDTKQIKKALNRLGYYMPLEKFGITGIPDAAVFDGLKRFQTDHGLTATGSSKPGDTTVTILNQEIVRPRDGSYIWRTVGDARVRAEHAGLDGTTRDWSDAPDPGDDYNCRCWAEALSNSAEARKQAILGEGKADFSIDKNPEANPNRPLHAIEGYSEVEEDKIIIEEEARKANIDPDLVKAIVYLETTQGWYDRIARDNNDSIRPMNLKISYWKNLGYSREDIKDPRKNIQAGIKLLKRIIYHMPKANIEEIATVYNSLGARKVTDYGARIDLLYKTKPWEK